MRFHQNLQIPTLEKLQPFHSLHITNSHHHKDLDKASVDSTKITYKAESQKNYKLSDPNVLFTMGMEHRVKQI
jgi:hypothetical protein